MKSILLIVSGSIAAVKTPDLIAKLRAKNIDVHVIVTRAGEEFVTKAELESASGHPVSTSLFDAKEKEEMWHIRFSREVDLVVVAPASADLIAKMANGFADDMASATLLANNKPLLVAPAMNTQMWIHPATGRNVARVEKDGATIIEPHEGMLACGEVGVGRMAEPADIVAAIESHFAQTTALRGLKALVTSGPTHEAIDPVRFIGNRSSGKQGHAIAKALRAAGADVTLVTGPTSLADPSGVAVKHVKSAEEMLAACDAALPADIVCCAAAVADWRVSTPSARKLKKAKDGDVPTIALIENPDIVAHIGGLQTGRPKLVVGFAAESENVLENAVKKRERKNCDWILANDVSDGKAFDVEHNEIILVTPGGSEPWPKLSKQEIADRLVARICNHIKEVA